MRGRGSRTGYILVEAVGALAVLSIGLVGIHHALRESLQTRGQARDYTQARFLLEELMGKLELQPVLVEEERSGAYEGELSRFRWRYAVESVNVGQEPVAVPPNGMPVIQSAFPVKRMGRIVGTVSWTRGGNPFECTAQTLVQPERLYASAP